MCGPIARLSGTVIQLVSNGVIINDVMSIVVGLSLKFDEEIIFQNIINEILRRRL